MYARLLALLEAALADARSMLELASAAQVAEFNQRRTVYLDRIAQLQCLSGAPERQTLSAGRNRKVSELMHELVLVDGQIRRFTEPLSADLDRWLGRIGTTPESR